MTENNGLSAEDNGILNSRTSSEEDVSKYMSTLSPEERAAYIDYMIFENRDIAEQKRKRDAQIIAEMNRKQGAGALDEGSETGARSSFTSDTPESSESTAPGETTGRARVLFRKASEGESETPIIAEDAQRAWDSAKKKKKHSHIMLYIAIGCSIFLVLLIIAAKIILSPSVTVVLP